MSGLREKKINLRFIIGTYVMRGIRKATRINELKSQLVKVKRYLTTSDLDLFY